MNGNTNGRTKARLMTTRLRTAMPIVIMASQRPTMTGSERRASASLRSKSLGHPCLSTAFLAWQVLQPLALRLQLIVRCSFHLNYFCAVVFSSLAIIDKTLGWPNLPCFYKVWKWSEKSNFFQFRRCSRPPSWRLLLHWRRPAPLCCLSTLLTRLFSARTLRGISQPKFKLKTSPSSRLLSRYNFFH